MKIAIKPFSQFVPAQGSSPAGLVTVSQVDVRINNLELGVGATCGYELQSVDTSDPKNPKTRGVASGSVALTPTQYGEWGTDDTVVALAVLSNIGLSAA